MLVSQGMCRLFGCRSKESSGVAHELFHAANALRVQSKEHPDGWGLAWYEGGAPRVVRSLTPAHGDEEFEKLSRFVRATTVLAHVRKASIGRISPENTHPFQCGRWLFAHNGTLPAWERGRSLLEELIAPQLRREMRGETDSERCFYLFLTQLRDRCDPENADAPSAAAALAESAAMAVDACGRDASTTFLATDGRLLLACRRGRTLFLCASQPDREGRHGYVAVASEDPGEPPPGGSRAWTLVAEEGLVCVDQELRLHVTTLRQ